MAAVGAAATLNELDETLVAEPEVATSVTPVAAVWKINEPKLATPEELVIDEPPL